MKSFWGNGIYGVWDFITIQRQKTFGIWTFPPVVISVQDPPEHRHLRPVEMAFTADRAAFFPCSPEALICVQQPCLIALSRPLAVSPPPASALVCSRVQIGRLCSTTAVCHNRDHLLCDTRNSPPRCLHANPWPFHCCGCSSCGRWHAGGVHEKGGSESAISRPDLSALTFSFFGKDLKLFHLFVYFFLRFYLDVTCWILSLGSFLWKETGRENTFFAESSCPIVGSKKSLLGGVFRPGTKQERDLSPITFVTKALYYQQWDQLNPAEYGSVLEQFWDLYNLARESMMQFPSGSQEIFPIPPCGRHEPWTQEEGILTTSPLNPLPPSSAAVSGGFVITTLPSGLWKSRPSLQLQG